MSGIVIKLLGTVHKTTIRPPKLNEDGEVTDQEIEIILRVPFDGHDEVRSKLGDVSRLQNGETTHIILADLAPKLDLG